MEATHTNFGNKHHNWVKINNTGTIDMARELWVHLLIKFQLLKIVSKRAIKKGIANPIEMVLMGNYPRDQQ